MTSKPMKAQEIRWLLWTNAMILTVSTGAACLQSPEADDDLRAQAQAIYYGTREPTVVHLTPGEQLAIGFLADPSGEEFCSGTLIDRDVVVTASHCTGGESASFIRFGLGDPTRPKALLEVQQVAEHPQLDAALLFLREDAVRRVPEVEPLPLLRTALPHSMIGGPVEAAGYGATHDDSRGRYFAALSLKAIEDTDYVVDGHGQRGICYGDSGGPLLVEREGQALVAGVESWGDETCVDVDYLTRLDLVVAWIDQQNGAFDPNHPASGEQPTGHQSDQPEEGGDASSPPPTGGPTSSPDGPSTGGSGCSVGGGAQPAVDARLLVLLPLGLIACVRRGRRP